MKLEIRHTFPCTPEAYWEMYWDPAFDALLMKDATVDREIVSESIVGDIMTRRMRFTPHQELPGAVAKIIGTSKLIYEQENVLDKSKGRMTWRVIPGPKLGKLNAAGIFELRPHPQGCEQVITGDITVGIPFIGGRIETAVVEQVKQGYVKMAEATIQWLAERKNA